MDVYYEKNVVNDSFTRHKRRNIVINVFRVLFGVMIFVAFIFVLFFFNYPPGGAALVMAIVTALFTVGFPIAMLVLLTRMLGRLNSEYDYYILSGTFRVVSVINRKKRRKLVEFPLSAIASIGLVESENYDRYYADRSVKKIFAACNDDEDLGYFYFSDGERKLLVLEFDAEFLAALKRSVLISVFDDSIKKTLINAEKAARRAADNAAGKEQAAGEEQAASEKQPAGEEQPTSEKQPESGGADEGADGK